MNSIERITYGITLTINSTDYDITDKCTLPSSVTSSIDNYGFIKHGSLNFTLDNSADYFTILDTDEDIYIKITASDITDTSLVIYEGIVDPYSIKIVNDDTIEMSSEDRSSSIDAELGEPNDNDFTHGGRLDLFLKEKLTDAGIAYTDFTWETGSEDGFNRIIGDFTFNNLSDGIKDYTQSTVLNNCVASLFTVGKKLFGLLIDTTNTQCFLKELHEFDADCGEFIYQGDLSYNSRYSTDGDNIILTVYIPTLKTASWKALPVDVFKGIDSRPVDKIYIYTITFDTVNFTVDTSEDDNYIVSINSQSESTGLPNYTTSGPYYTLPKQMTLFNSEYNLFWAYVSDTEWNKQGMVVLKKWTVNDIEMLSTYYGLKGASSWVSPNVWGASLPLPIRLVFAGGDCEASRAISLDYVIRGYIAYDDDFKALSISESCEFNNFKCSPELTGDYGIMKEDATTSPETFISDFEGMPAQLTSWVKVHTDATYDYYLANLYYNMGWHNTTYDGYCNHLVKIKIDRTDSTQYKIASSGGVALVASTFNNHPGQVRPVYPLGVSTSALYQWIVGDEITWYTYTGTADTTNFTPASYDFPVELSVSKLYNLLWFPINIDTTPTTYDGANQFFVVLSNTPKDLLISEFGGRKKTTEDTQRITVLRDSAYSTCYQQINERPRSGSLVNLLNDSLANSNNYAYVSGGTLKFINKEEIDTSTAVSIETTYLVDEIKYLRGSDYYAGFKAIDNVNNEFSIGVIDNNSVLAETTTFLQEPTLWNNLNKLRELYATDLGDLTLNISGIDLDIDRLTPISYDSAYWYIKERTLDLSNSMTSLKIAPLNETEDRYYIYDLIDYTSFNNGTLSNCAAYADNSMSLNTTRLSNIGVYASSASATATYAITVPFTGKPVAIDVSGVNTYSIDLKENSGAYVNFTTSTNKVSGVSSGTEYTLRINLPAVRDTVNYLKIYFKEV